MDTPPRKSRGTPLLVSTRFSLSEENEQVGAERYGRTRLASPNSQAWTGIGKCYFSLFSWPQAGLTTSPDWYMICSIINVVTIHTYWVVQPMRHEGGGSNATHPFPSGFTANCPLFLHTNDVITLAVCLFGSLLVLLSPGFWLDYCFLAECSYSYTSLNRHVCNQHITFCGHLTAKPSGSKTIMFVVIHHQVYTTIHFSVFLHNVFEESRKSTRSIR